MNLSSNMIAILVLAAIIVGLWLYTKSVKTRALFFYHPNCGHCTAFKSAWEQIKGLITMPAKDINCEDNPDNCIAYGVEGYPTIMVEKNGRTTEFNDKRSVENVVKFIESV